jgi:hypothetical protein
MEGKHVKSRIVNSTVKSIMLVLALALVTPVLAQYNSEYDVYLQVENKLAEKVAKLLGVGSLGSQAFDTQEGAHATVTDTSGEEIEHYYIWICIGDQCVPVDPFRASN